MKKIVLNLICAVLALQDIEICEDGKAAITEDQLNALENALKDKNDRISALETEKQTAITDKQTADQAKANAETALATLQQEFNAFKEEAGGDSPRHAATSNTHKEPTTAKELLNDIKNLL